MVRDHTTDQVSLDGEQALNEETSADMVKDDPKVESGSDTMKDDPKAKTHNETDAPVATEAEKDSTKVPDEGDSTHADGADKTQAKDNGLLVVTTGEVDIEQNMNSFDVQRDFSCSNLKTFACSDAFPTADRAVATKNPKDIPWPLSPSKDPVVLAREAAEKEEAERIEESSTAALVDEISGKSQGKGIEETSSPVAAKNPAKEGGATEDETNIPEQQPAAEATQEPQKSPLAGKPGVIVEEEDKFTKKAESMAYNCDAVGCGNNCIIL
jgi:hypothetical protein